MREYIFITDRRLSWWRRKYLVYRLWRHGH